MATSKQELEALINAQITDNGTNAITGPILNEILQKLLTLVPSQTFSFPKAASVTIGDVGKLMMNVDGEAEIANPSGAIEAVKGEWTFEPTAGATVDTGYLYTELLAINDNFINDDDEIINISGAVYYSAAISLSAPSGTVSGSYKYPDNATDFADNIYWALTNATAYFTAEGGSPETLPITDYFDITRLGNVITVKQKFFSSSQPNFTHRYEPQAPIDLVTINEPVVYHAAYMQYPILGVLGHVASGTAEIVNAEVVKLTLNKDVVFEELNEETGTIPGNLLKRLLIPVEDGKVEPLLFDGKLNEQMPFQSYNDFNGPFDEFRKRGSFTIYEALEEGIADEQILARRVKLVFNDIDGVIDDYGYVYGEYYY